MPEEIEDIFSEEYFTLDKEGHLAAIKGYREAKTAVHMLRHLIKKSYLKDGLTNDEAIEETNRVEEASRKLASLEVTSEIKSYVLLKKKD